MTMILQSVAFSEPYRYVSVPPGEHAVVWYLSIPRGCAAFIRKVAVDTYSDTYTNWEVDGRLVEKIMRTVLWTTSFVPEEFNPPYIARRWIKFTFFNNSELTLTPGVLCNGELVTPIYS